MSQKIVVNEKEITIYPAVEKDQPLILLNNFSGDGKSIRDELDKLNAPDMNFVSIGNLNWDHEMSPWYCPALSADDTPCTGGADEFLPILTEKILPAVLENLQGTPKFIGLAGYSLAGLFAIYATYHTEIFERVASMSGSLWFPDFVEYVEQHEMKRVPKKFYISLGDREAKTRNKILQTVQENTEKIVAYYQSQSIPVEFELNPGNHYKNPALRTAKGIIAIF